jgi:hypothetical protein
MDTRSEIRDFLTSRRARITPQAVGLKVFGPRRVPRLRREEVATLAGLSVDYYNGLERGNLGGASDSVQWMLDSMTASAAFAENGRLDALGANRLGRALYAALFGKSRRQPANWARFVFLSPEAPDFYGDWDRTAKDCVAILRSEAGRHPHDRELSNLVGELATAEPGSRSAEAFALLASWTAPSDPEAHKVDRDAARRTT